MESRCLMSVTSAPSNVPSSVIPLERTDSHSVDRQNQINETIQSSYNHVIFVGDSNVEYFSTIGATAWSNTITPIGGVANFGVASDKTQNLIWRLENGELGQKPNVVVVEIGMNNVLFNNGKPTPDVYSSQIVSQTVAGISAVAQTISRISPESTVILMGVFPVGATPSDPQRLEVQDINTQLGQLAAGMNKVQFLDINNQLLNPDGTRTSTPYGIHLSPALYANWANAISGPLTRRIDPTGSNAAQQLWTTANTTTNQPDIIVIDLGGTRTSTSRKSTPGTPTLGE